MKIVIDARFYGTEHTGLGRYTLNFLQTLKQLPQAKQHDFYLLVRRRYLKLEFPSNFHLVEAELEHYSLSEQIFLPRLLASLKPDLFHSLHFNVPLFYRQPFIVTVHDLIKSHFTSKETTTQPTPIFKLKRWGYQQVIHHALFDSYAVIVPSQTVKQDILQQYPTLAPQKTYPIYEAPDPVFTHFKPGYFKPGLLQTRFVKTSRRQSPVTGHYLLYVGNAYPHKNLKTLLQAFQLLLPSWPKLTLVIISKSTPFLTKTLAQFPHLSQNIQVIANLSDQELASFYQRARLTVIPSLMEGFSLTGLESLSLGTPVVASDIPVHREIYGQAVIYADPHSPQDFATKLNQALTQAQLKTKLPRSYSWQNLSNSIINLYENYEKDSSRLRSAQ